MMDKKEIEKYIKLYPRIDEEIKSLEDDLKFYESKKTEYEINNPHKLRDDLIEKIDNGLSQKHDEILELMSIKEYISIALKRAGTDCRKIVDLRLWKRRSWNEISDEMNIGNRQAERIYKQIFRYFDKFTIKTHYDV
jgi:vacuolar-type H+-ATPase subunit I/STV1